MSFQSQQLSRSSSVAAAKTTRPGRAVPLRVDGAAWAGYQCRSGKSHTYVRIGIWTANILILK
jgi:hypothetical protein